MLLFARSTSENKFSKMLHEISTFAEQSNPARIVIYIKIFVQFVQFVFKKKIKNGED